MHLEYPWKNLFASLLSHADCSHRRVVKTKVVHPVFNEQAVGLACGLVSEELILLVLKYILIWNSLL